MPAVTQTRKIIVSVDTTNAKALNDIAAKMGMLNKNTKSLSDNMSFLTNAFRGWLGFLGVREIVRMADEMQNLGNRLKVVSQVGENTANTMAKLEQLAARTNQSIGGVAEVYTRMASALKGAKATSGELLALTESLINTFRVAGATTTETINTIIQLSQAFSSGELRGQELRSVMEQNATLAGLLRERFGKDIYKKAADGAIKVTDVLKVLAENQTKIAEQAKLLAPTFEQTLTKAMNQFSVSIGKLNEQMGLSANFAVLMQVAMDNLGSIMTVTGGVISLWAISYIPSLIAQLGKLRLAMIAFAAANPMLLLLTGLTVAGTLLYQNWEKLLKMMSYFKASVLDISATLEEKLLPIREKLASFLSIDMARASSKTKENIAAMRKSAADIRKAISEDKAKPAEQNDPGKELDSLIKKLESFSGASGKVTKLKDELAALNKELYDGKITLATYNERLIAFDFKKVSTQFKEGKTDVFKFHEQLRDLNIEELNRQLNIGAITMQQFNDKVAGEKLKVLNEQLDAGQISLAKYNKELTLLEDKFRPGSVFQAGVQSYLDSIGTLSQNVTKGIEQAFGHLENNLTEFIKTGTFNFAKFTQSILDDLAQIIVRASIVRPLAQGLLNFGGIDTSGAGGGFGGQGGGNTLLPNAKGNAFQGGKLLPFAKGGIVDTPTAFSFGGGKKGIMGEAGSEAIMPLRRSSNGDLGVAATVTPLTVNIINNAGVDVQSQETTGPGGEKILEVIILKTVKSGLANGSFDKDMKTNYSLARKGF